MRNGLGWLKLRSQWATLVRALSSSPRFPYTAYQIGYETADSPLESDLNRVFEYGYRYVIKSRQSERLRVIERQNAEVQRLQRRRRLPMIRPTGCLSFCVTHQTIKLTELRLVRKL